eukprot:gene12168-18807_t
MPSAQSGGFDSYYGASPMPGQVPPQLRRYCSSGVAFVRAVNKVGGKRTTQRRVLVVGAEGFILCRQDRDMIVRRFLRYDELLSVSASRHPVTKVIQVLVKSKPPEHDLFVYFDYDPLNGGDSSWHHAKEFCAAVGELHGKNVPGQPLLISCNENSGDLGHIARLEKSDRLVSPAVKLRQTIHDRALRRLGGFIPPPAPPAAPPSHQPYYGSPSPLPPPPAAATQRSGHAPAPSSHQYQQLPSPAHSPARSPGLPPAAHHSSPAPRLKEVVVSPTSSAPPSPGAHPRSKQSSRGARSPTSALNLPRGEAYTVSLEYPGEMLGLDYSEHDNGAIKLDRVLPYSAASRCGVPRGRLLRVNGKPIVHPGDLDEEVDAWRKGNGTALYLEIGEMDGEDDRGPEQPPEYLSPREKKLWQHRKALERWEEDLLVRERQLSEMESLEGAINADDSASMVSGSGRESARFSEAGETSASHPPSIGRLSGIRPRAHGARQSTGKSRAASAIADIIEQLPEMVAGRHSATREANEFTDPPRSPLGLSRHQNEDLDVHLHVY